MLNILFLCTGNSARSIMAEFAASDPHIGQGKLRGLSAGSFPTGTPNPFALSTLANHGVLADGAASKSWDVFSAPDAPSVDVMITVCDAAASESCPIWPGRPATAHWGVPDPAGVEGSDAEKAEAFEAAYQTLTARIKAFASHPLESLDEAGIRAAAQSVAHLQAGA